MIRRATDEHRFVERVIERPEFLFRRPRAEVVAELAADGFAAVDGGYDHLLRIPFAAATEERLAKLARDRAAAEAGRRAGGAHRARPLGARPGGARGGVRRVLRRQGRAPHDPDDPDAGTVIAKGRPAKRIKRA